MDSADPSRRALAAVLATTIRTGRFPDVRGFESEHPQLRNQCRRLAEDGRYLARIFWRDELEPVPARYAVTVRGVYEVENSQGTYEIQGLTRTFEALSRLARAKPEFYAGHYVPLQRLHRSAKSQDDFDDFTRWATLLTSPRLSGHADKDPIGYLGASDATGTANRETGMFSDVVLRDSFVFPDELAMRGKRRDFLLDVGGLRTQREDGRVVFLRGVERRAVLDPNLGACVLEVLIASPGIEIHVFDLQAAAAGLAPADADDGWAAGELLERLDQLGVDYERAVPGEWAPPHWARLAAALRRLDLLAGLSKSDADHLPKWARDPEGGRDALLRELSGQLAIDPLAADWPPIKNACRTVGRALSGALEHHALRGLEPAFRGGEWLTYRGGV